MNKQIARTLSVFSLTMITVTSVDSIRNLPSTALFGSSLIFFFLLATVCFLIPCSLVSAELATCHPRFGGVYVWVKDAFGELAGFFAIWFQWIENMIWYPTILSFIAGTIAYLISPALASNKYFLVSVILVAFWSTTIINLLGIKSSSRFSAFCGIAGLMLPMIFIIILGIIWLVLGKPIQVHFTHAELLPSFADTNLWVSMTAVILSMCGMEITTVHAQDVANPQRDYVKALLYSTVILIFTLTMGSLAIAIVVPHDKINLVAGIMQAFDAFFAAYHMQWVLPLAALSLIIGGLGSVSNWIIAPARGLFFAARDGCLPVFLQKINPVGAPSSLLIYQAILVSIIAMVFLLLPSVNSSYWLLTALTSQLYMFMYILMFAAGIRLRFKYPDMERPFKVPGGTIGMCCIGGLGIFSSIVTVGVGFIPVPDFKIGNLWLYEGLILGGLIALSLPPLVMYALRRPHWKLVG